MVCTLSSHLIWNLLLIGVQPTLNIDSREITSEIETIQHHSQMSLSAGQQQLLVAERQLILIVTARHLFKDLHKPGVHPTTCEWWHIFVRFCHQGYQNKYFEFCEKIVVAAENDDDDTWLGRTAVAWDGWEWSSNYPLFSPARPLILSECHLGARPLTPKQGHKSHWAKETGTLQWQSHLVPLQLTEWHHPNYLAN